MRESFCPLSPRSHCSVLTPTETRNTDGQLTKLTTLLKQLDLDMKTLKNDVSNVKDSLSATIKKPACVGCSVLPLEDLTLDLDVSVSANRT